MNRREILKNILKAAITGAALGATESFAKAAGLNKYAEMVRMQQDVIAIHKLMIEKTTGPYYRDERYMETMSPKVDNILTFSMANFTGDYHSAEAFEECRKLFNDRDYADTMTEEGLKKIFEVVVPVAVMRNLLAKHKVTFSPSGMKSWNDFATRYQAMILQA
jgi:hypothetical protein